MALWQDLRYAARALRHHPGFTAVAVLALALGIGGNTAIFSVANGLLVKPLPYPDPSRLIRVFESNPAAGFPRFPISPANFLDYREQNRVFESLAIFTRRDFELSMGDRPERLSGLAISAGYFGVLGFRPQLGREFERADELSEAGLVILSHGVWERRLHGDANIIGRSIRLSGVPHTVVGVMPRGLQHVGGDYRSLPHGDAVDVWAPMRLVPGRSPRGAHFLNAIGRLRQGIPLEPAGLNMNLTAEALERQYPETNRNWRIRLETLRDDIVGRAQPLLLVLMGAVGFVLLIGCVNVANLLLARATFRQRELAVRSALGAGRARLIRLFLAESLLLAALGGAAGLALSMLGVRILLAIAPQNLPRLHEISVDARVFLFAFGLTLLTGTVCGLAPALRSSRVDLSQALKEGSRSATGGLRQTAIRDLLVLAEVSLAFVLLVGAGLLMKSFLLLLRTDPGFRPESVITMSISLPPARYQQGVSRFFAEIVERVGKLPGVLSAGASSDLPWTGYDENSSFRIEGRPESPQDRIHARFHSVTETYFQAIGVSLAAGRFFDARDNQEAPRVILVNQSMAHRYWPGEAAVGKRITFSGQPAAKDWFTIVGVIGDVKDAPRDRQAEPAFYWSHRQQSLRSMMLAVRSGLPPQELIPAIRGEIAALDLDLPIADVRTLEEIASAAVAEQRFGLAVFTIFAGLALLLSAIGIYGVISYSVNQRVHEIGIRMAIGASRRNISTIVLLQCLKATAGGLLFGVALSLGVTRLLEGFLFEVKPTDPASLIGAVLVLLTAALVACWVPLRRALAVDPAIALREE